MRKIQVTEDFIKYTKELTEDILGYNKCFGGDKEVMKKQREHINKCKKYLETLEKKGV